MSNKTELVERDERQLTHGQATIPEVVDLSRIKELRQNQDLGILEKHLMIVEESRVIRAQRKHLLQRALTVENETIDTKAELAIKSIKRYEAEMSLLIQEGFVTVVGELERKVAMNMLHCIRGFGIELTAFQEQLDSDHIEDWMKERISKKKKGLSNTWSHSSCCWSSVSSTARRKQSELRNQMPSHGRLAMNEGKLTSMKHCLQSLLSDDAATTASERRVLQAISKQIDEFGREMQSVQTKLNDSRIEASLRKRLSQHCEDSLYRFEEKLAQFLERIPAASRCGAGVNKLEED